MPEIRPLDTADILAAVKNGGAKPPTSPLGRMDINYGVPGQGGILTEWAESVPDLMWPESIRTYGRMRRDPKLTAVLHAFYLPILRSTWVVDPEGVTNSKAVDLVAGDLGLGILGEKKPPPFTGPQGFHFYDHVRLALLSLVFGHFPFEKWFNQSKGLTHLAGLEERQPHTIAIIDLEDSGYIREVTQNTQMVPLPAQRLLWYCREREGANWSGVSILRACYTPWILKHETLRVHATSLRRFGMGVPTVNAPPGATPSQITEAGQLAAGFRAGDQAGVGLPAGFTFNLTGITGTVPDAVAFLGYLDQQMVGSALAQMLELGMGGRGGARALGETFLDFFLLALQAAADALGNTCTYGDPGMAGVSRALVDYNFGPDEPCPKIISADVGDRHEVTALALQQLLASGAISPDENLEAYVRDVWNLPDRAVIPLAPGMPGAPGTLPPGWTEPGAAPPPKGPAPGPGATPRPGTNPPPAAPGPGPRPPAPSYSGVGAPGRIGGQPATASTAAAAQVTLGTPLTDPGGAPFHRDLTPLEAAAGLDPAGMAHELATATDRVLAAWHPVLSEQRQDLADQVAAAVDGGEIGQLAALATPAGTGVGILYRAMQAQAARGMGRAIGEAAGQGVTIDPAAVRIDQDRLWQLARARAQLAAAPMAQAASSRALQVVTASAGTDAAREVHATLRGLSPRPLADQLMAALHAASNEGRMAVLDAGPEAEYTASEIMDRNTCQPCASVDGHTFADLADARAAYANGGYVDCAGGLRCRGTIVAAWPGLSVTRPGEPQPGGYPYPGEASPLDLTATAGDPPQVAAEWDEDLHPRGPHGRFAPGKGALTHGEPTALSRHYNDIPETRGLARHKGTYTGPVERDLQDRAALGRGVRTIAEPITPKEARDGSRPVTNAEFQELARQGVNQLGMLRARRTPAAGLDDNWPRIKDHAWTESRKSWGGATIDAHTGKPLATDADKYALSVKKAGMHTVSVPEDSSRAQFDAAMDRALGEFRGILEAQQSYLGVFHDDEEHRVDIDPVLVVDSVHEVEAIGAYTHAVGGAYHFASGNGVWPPHVTDQASLGLTASADGETVHWAGPGQWRTNADKVQPGLSPEQDAEIGQAGATPVPEPGPKASWEEGLHPRGYHGKFARLGGGKGGGKVSRETGKLPWTADGGTARYTGSLDIDRADMPQLSGTVKGTYRPSAEMTPKFIARLRGKGIKVTTARVPAASLKPTQATGDTAAIRRMADQLKSGKMTDTKPVIVSSDGRVLDGHHNWAGRVLADTEGGRKGLDPGMPVHQVNMPMKDLLGEAHAFAREEGIPGRGAGEFANPKYANYGTVPPRDTLAKYTRPDGTFTPERAALHKQIVDKITGGHKPQDHPRALFLGGGPASGKSHLQALPDSARIDPDQIKTQLPEFRQMAAARDPAAATYTHEESSYVSKQALAEAQRRRINYTMDGTGDSEYAKLAGKVTQARKAGYAVDAKYVTADIPEAINRAMKRAAEPGPNQGRMIPAPVIRDIHQHVTSTFQQAVANGLFDHVELHDTNGPQPTLIGAGEGKNFTIADQAAWERFLAKTKTKPPAEAPAAAADAAGDTAIAILRALLAGDSYPPPGVTDTPANRALWAETAQAIEDLPGGVIPDIPADWATLPDTEHPPPPAPR